MRRSLALAGIAACAAALAAGCSPVIRNHGYTPQPAELAELQVGLDTRATVQSKIGRPAGTGIFTDDGWYYVSSKVEHLTYHAPEVVDRRVVAVLFDQNDVLAAVNEYGLEDGRVVDLETKTTPTYGRQLTILEQAFSNIGVITEDQLTGDE
jgi:outer membrane protein assembly factor BamE (lipoprotein component of BamABCDE complex)